MDSKALARLVTRAVNLDRLVKEQTAQLEEMKATLRAQAESAIRRERGLKADAPLHELDHVFSGTCGNIARVSFPEAGLVRQFQAAGRDRFIRWDNERGKYVPISPEVKTLAGKHFQALYTQAFKPKKTFRELCGALLSKADAKRLLALLGEEQSPRVSFETK